MIQQQYVKLKAAYQAATQDRTELLQRIRAAEEDLKKMAALMDHYEKNGKQQAHHELDDAYQQAYPDYTKIFRQLAVIEEELSRLASLLKPVDEYLRDTGFFPGLGPRVRRKTSRQRRRG